MINGVQIFLIVTQIFLETENGIYQQRFTAPVRMSLQDIENKVKEMQGDKPVNWDKLTIKLPEGGQLALPDDATWEEEFDYQVIDHRKEKE